MPTIITAGRLPQTLIYQATCSNCKTVFQFKRDEAASVPSGRNESALKIKCPFEGCNHMVYTEDKPCS